MVEDKAFNAFLKEKLEEGLEIPNVRIPRRSAGSLRYPMLIAASLAVLLGLFGLSSRSVRGGRNENRLSAAIEFLETCEGTIALSEKGDETFAERLLAWQDAPYAEVVGL